jgi:cell division protein FtsI/penicillin-binding protein 2
LGKNANFMQVILIQDVNNLGGANELVTVKNGYGRNFLIPSKLAVEASPSNLKQLNEKLKQQAKKEAKLLAEINSVIAALTDGALKIGAKTGTAQLGLLKNRVNSWVVGFFPYENPKYAFTIMMESGPASGSVGASSIMRNLLDWMAIYTPEYFK